MAARRPDKTSNPWLPADYDSRVVTGVKALAEGKASEVQQKEVLTWIVRELGQWQASEFIAGGDEGRRASDFLSGRRWVAVQIQKMVDMPNKVLDALRKKEKGNGP